MGAASGHVRQPGILSRAMSAACVVFKIGWIAPAGV